MMASVTNPITKLERQAVNKDDEGPKLVEQPCRRAAADRPAFIANDASRFLTVAETAALLEVTEDVLFRWRVWGRGPQLVPRPEGWRYSAIRVEEFAALPPWRRMLTIRRRYY